MKNVIILCLSMMFSFVGLAQERREFGKVYDTAANAKEDIRNAVSKAQKEHKNVLLQIGGNWCIWCIRFNNLVTKNDTLNRIMNYNYVVVHVNYDPQKTQDKAFWSELGNPQRFGFPVFVILDETGKVIHIQNSSYLEEADGHNPKKVAEFLKQWTPAAVKTGIVY